MNDRIRWWAPCVPILGCMMWCGTAMAYEIDTHKSMTEAAIAITSLPHQKAGDLGVRADQTFPNPAGGDPLTFPELIAEGSIHEDDNRRPAHHFFDPVYDRALTAHPVIDSISEKSPDWALEDSDEFELQAYSYRDARQYLYEALTKPTKTERDEAMGKLFRTLGQVVHHIQDMAQPQHVRNDAHLDSIGVALLLGGPLFVMKLQNPSFYERWTNDRDVRPYLPYSAPYETVNRFTTPREFWHDVHGRGLAQFTNWNFVSDGTNFGSGTGYNFPLRDPDLKPQRDIRELCAEAQPACTNPDLRGTITFLSTWVEDKYTGQTMWNPYASSYSVFDKHLKRRGFNAVYSLNRFNFAFAHSLLIPRAVHYSAGLIDYFFRGELTVKGAKPHGVFALVDQRPPFPGASQGFWRIKASLLNETPPIINAIGEEVPQEMSQGKLIAVAKFYRDHCFNFTDGTSGAYLVPPMGYVPCRSSQEEVIVSNEIDIGMGGITVPTSGEPVTVTFQFPYAIPLNATDLSMQFVYRGVLGSEPDAVVVKSIDLSEPTPVHVSNDRDWTFDVDGNAIRVENPQALPRAIFIFAEGDSSPPMPLFGFSESGAVGAGQYAGVWALVDIDAPPRYSAAICDTCGFALNPLIPYRVESEPGSSQATRSTPVYNIRGMWGANGFSFYNNYPEKCADKTVADCWTENFSPYDPVGPSAGVNIRWGNGP